MIDAYKTLSYFCAMLKNLHLLAILATIAFHSFRKNFTRTGITGSNQSALIAF
jgi:hypothetical protein